MTTKVVAGRGEGVTRATKIRELQERGKMDQIQAAIVEMEGTIEGTKFAVGDPRLPVAVRTALA